MVAFLLRFIAFMAGLWIVRRLLGLLFAGQGARASGGRGRAGNAGKTPSNRMVKDPVCGMYMDARLAVRTEDREGTHYFCSEECRNKFEVRTL